MLVGAENEKSKIFPYLPTQSNFMYIFWHPFYTSIHEKHHYFEELLPSPTPPTPSDETGIFQYRLGLYPAVYEGSKYHSQRKRKTLRIAELIIFVFVHFKICVVETKPHIVCNFLRFRSPRFLVAAQSLFKADIMIMTWVHNRALCQKCLRLMNWNLFLWKFLKLQNIIISARETRYA